MQSMQQYPPKDKRSKGKKDEWIFCKKWEKWMHDMCENVNVRLNKISEGYIYKNGYCNVFFKMYGHDISIV